MTNNQVWQNISGKVGMDLLPELVANPEFVNAFLEAVLQSHRVETGDGVLPALTTTSELAKDLVRDQFFVADFLTALADQVHADNVNAGWWTDLKTGEDLHGLDANGRPKRNVPELLMLIVSEISEGMEGYRKKLNDDKLTHRPMLKVELIDAVIRILDVLGSEGNDVHPAGTIFEEKRSYNKQRADHKPENRRNGGKEF